MIRQKAQLLVPAVLAMGLLVVTAAPIRSAELPPAVTRQIDFEKDVQPLFRRACYSCHSADEQEGGLRLDNRARAYDGGDAGKAILKGKSAESLLIQLVAGLNEDLGTMPPDGAGTPLSAEEVGILRAWIDQGAAWPDNADTKIVSNHWSFQPILIPELPAVKNKRWVKNDIDPFVLSQLESKGIMPSPQASRSVLIRRLYLDLLGLLPSPEETVEFLSDQRPDAYQHLVERVLKSPHYGERWGRHWLDLARYADSDGYEKDRARPHAWRYRHWVIDALNADMPFDQFSTFQIAGDMLATPSIDSRVASGFHRNTLHNTEGGTDQEEDRVKKTVDRTNTFGTIWLGLTVGCAQCHTHKYDPISHREYYALYGFFNNINEQDIDAPTAADQAAYETAKKTFDDAHAPLLAAVNAYRSEKLPAAFAQWETDAARDIYSWESVTPSYLESTKGAEMVADASAAVLVTGANEISDKYLVHFKHTGVLSGIRLEVLPHDALVAKGPGRAENGNFVLTTLSVHIKPAGEGAETRPVKISRAVADFSQNEWEITKAINDDVNDGWAVSPEFGKRHVAAFQFEAPVEVAETDEVVVTLDQHYENSSAHNIGHFRISKASFAGELALEGTDKAVVDALAVAAAERNDEQKKKLLEFYSAIDPELRKLNMAVSEHAKKAPSMPGTKAQSVVETNVRPLNIHIRGNFLTKGDDVKTSGPEFLPVVSKRGDQLDRLDLAKWTFSEENPLTARVTVNRLWFRYFGRGLVETIDDFGSQGELPSHPLLLDYLANQFRQNGWSLKHIHRLIVNSATYQQQSAVRRELKEIDPQNTLLARQSRHRVEAEVIRDLALDASGLLSRKVGGPSVRPPQPTEYSTLTYANSAKWSESSGEDRYRRGLYTFFQRTSPYPMLMTFDAPDSNVCAAQRSLSNTPLQALTLWNDRVFMECARNLGAKLAAANENTSGSADLQSHRIQQAFLTCLSRYATDDEAHSVDSFYKNQVELLSVNDEAVAAINSNLEVPVGVRAVDLAAWVATARVLLNLDEFITRE